MNEPLSPPSDFSKVPLFGTTQTVMEHTGLTYRRARQLIALAGFAQRKVVPMAAVLAEAQRCSLEGLPIAKRKGGIQ